MAVHSLQRLDQEFKDADDRLVVLEFYADWCDPCKAIGPKIEVSAHLYQEYTYLVLYRCMHNTHESSVAK